MSPTSRPQVPLPPEVASTRGFGIADRFLLSLDPGAIDQVASTTTPAPPTVQEPRDPAGGDLIECQRQAAAAHPLVSEPVDDAVLRKAWADSVGSDAARGARERWAGCIEAHGAPVRTRDEAIGALMDLESALAATVVPAVDGSPPVYDHDLFDELRTSEIAAATADSACTPALDRSMDEIYERTLRSLLG